MSDLTVSLWKELEAEGAVFERRLSDSTTLWFSPKTRRMFSVPENVNEATRLSVLTESGLG